MVIIMKVRIKSVVKVVGEEELIVIPLARKGDFVEALNFYEDIPGGRVARLVLIYDKYGEISDEPSPIGIKGKKAYLEAKGVEEDLNEIKRVIPIEREVKSDVVPLFIDIQILSDVSTSSRGVRGFINYISRHKDVNFNALKGVIKLEELV